MFRFLWLALGAATVACVALYFVSGRPRYLRWGRGLFFVSLATGVFFFTVLLVKRLI